MTVIYKEFGGFKPCWSCGVSLSETPENTNALVSTQWLPPLTICPKTENCFIERKGYCKVKIFAHFSLCSFSMLLYSL